MLRRSTLTFLARFVLAWFVLVVGVSATAAMVTPQAFDVICSGGGMKVMNAGGGEGQPVMQASLDCPMCLAVAPPPPVATAALPQPEPLGRALQPIPSARIAAQPAAALPPRGPPALS